MSKQFIAQAIVLLLGVSSVYGQANLSRMATSRKKHAHNYSPEGLVLGL